MKNTDISDRDRETINNNKKLKTTTDLEEKRITSQKLKVKTKMKVMNKKRNLSQLKKMNCHAGK